MSGYSILLNSKIRVIKCLELELELGIYMLESKVTLEKNFYLIALNWFRKITKSRNKLISWQSDVKL